MFEFQKMMLGSERRVGCPPSKKRRQTEFGHGLCCVCYMRRVDGVCGGCVGTAAQAVVVSEEGRGMLQCVVMFTMMR